MIGLAYYINDLNTRFTNLLFTTKTRKFSGLANINLVTGLPYARKSNGDYEDVLFNDSYDLTSFYIEAGDRKPLPGGYTALIDLIVCVNMDSFVGYETEDIINEVHKIARVTQFEPTGVVIDFEALAGFTYPEKVSDTMNPYFVFRIKNKLVGTYKIN